MSQPTPAPAPSPWWAALRSCATLILTFLAGAGVTVGTMQVKGCLPPAPVPVPTEPSADNPIILPDTFSAAVGRRDDLQAKVFKGTSLTWIVDPADNDALQTKPDSSTSLVIVPRDKGIYYIGAIDKGGKMTAPAWCRVTTGDVPPPIPPPVPTDPFTVTLQTAANLDTAADRTKIPQLAALYRQSVNTVNDKSITTAKQLLDTMHGAAQSLIGDSLPNLRKALATELNATMPTQSTAVLDDATRAKAAAEFTKISTALSGVK
jgi:hypothetical protein